MLGLVAWRQRPPTVVPANASPDLFSGARAFVQLERVLEDMGPHPVGTDANRVVLERLQRRLDELGIAWQVQRAWVCNNGWNCSAVDNLIGTLPGETQDNLVLLAHYDSQRMGPGAADDGAGVAALLEAGRLLQERPLRNPVQLVFTDGEEMGLFGAQAVVAEPPWEGRTAVVVNLEARGTGGQASLFQTSPDAGWLIEAFTRSARQPFTSSLHATVYENLPSDTDLTIFLEAGIEGVNLAFTDGLPRYHTAIDDLDHLDPRSVQHLGQQGVGLVQHLSQLDLDAVRHPGELVYTDVLGWFVLRWPRPWTLPLALLALGGVLGLGERRPRALFGGLGLALVGLVGAVLVGIVGEMALVALEGNWTGVPEPFRWFCWLSALALGVGLGGLSARLGVRGVWSGVWLVWALLGLALAWVAPGASIFFIVPTLWAVSVSLVARIAGWEGWGAQLVGGLVGLMLWLALARALEVGVDLIGLIVVVPVLLASQPLWPAWSAGGMSRVVPAGLAFGALGAFLTTLFMEPATPHRPQHLQEVLVQRADETVGKAFSSFEPDPMGRRSQMPPLPGVVPSEEALLSRRWGRWFRELEVAPHPGPELTLTPTGLRTAQLEVAPVGEAVAFQLGFEPVPVVRIEGQQVGDGSTPLLYLHGDGPFTLELTWPEFQEASLDVAQIISSPAPGSDWPQHLLPAHKGSRTVVYRTLELTAESLEPPDLDPATTSGPSTR